MYAKIKGAKTEMVKEGDASVKFLHKTHTEL